MGANTLHQRLRNVVGAKTYRELGELTQTNAETARRYVLGQTPSVEFVTALCQTQGVNPTWLLTGDGPMRLADARSHALRDANAHELLAAVATTLEQLAERVGRLEVFLQTMETRLRAAHIGAGHGGTTWTKGGSGMEGAAAGGEGGLDGTRTIPEGPSKASQHASTSEGCSPEALGPEPSNPHTPKPSAARGLSDFIADGVDASGPD